MRSSQSINKGSAEVAHGAEHMEAYNNGSAEVAHSTSPKCGACTVLRASSLHIMEYSVRF